MRRLNNFFVPVLAGASLFALCFSSCSTESSSGTDDDDSVVSYEKGQNPFDSSSSGTVDQGGADNPSSENSQDNKPADAKSSPSSSGDGSKPTPQSAATADWMPASSATTETVSSEEVLAEAKKVVNGSCAPMTTEIEKGGMATWAFFRQNGDVFDQIMSPFVWTFDDGKVLKGNGMDKVNKTYETSGVYKASLNVDGNDIECDPLRVQGIPITVTSCKAAKNAVNAGETITWTVVAESEAEITGYSWKSSDAEVSGSGTSATMVATGEMHKKNVSATVSVTNSDKTVQDYACELVSAGGGCVITGMAIGVDGAAARGALLENGPCIGVLGTAIDVNYPASNASLIDDVAAVGAIVSEFPPGYPTKPENFPRRNRIISGLSCGVCIVEAPRRSGALITADLALEQGRDLFVVPGNADSPNSAGSNALLRDCARAVTTGTDILSEYEGLYPNAVRPVKEIFTPQEKPAEPPEAAKTEIDNPPAIPYIDVESRLSAYTEDQQAMLRCLLDGEAHIDEIISSTGFTPSKVLAGMTLLVIRGAVRSHPGTRFSMNLKQL